MMNELEFDRTRFEAGEMPRLRDGRKVHALVYDMRNNEYVGVADSGGGGLIEYRWSSLGGNKWSPSADLVHDPRTVRVRTIWHRCTWDRSLIQARVFPEGFDVAKWMSVMAGEVLKDEIIEVPLP